MSDKPEADLKSISGAAYDAGWGWGHNLDAESFGRVGKRAPARF